MSDHNRSNDGHSLYGCSGDGTICAITFDAKEVPELAAPEATQLVLDQYQYHPPKRASHRPLANPQLPMTNGFGTSHTSTGHVNVLQPRKGKLVDQRRRIGLAGSAANGVVHTEEDAFSAAPIQPFASSSTAQASTARMFQDAHVAFSGGVRQHGAGEGTELPKSGTKRKASLLGEESPRAARGRMMTSTNPRQIGEVREIRAIKVNVTDVASGAGRALPTPRIQTLLRVKPVDTDNSCYLEAQNAEDPTKRNKITYCANGQDQWLDYLPSAVLVMAASARFCAVACEDRSISVYSPAGRQ